MRRLLLTASVALACATLAQPSNAQVRFGGQAALITGLEEVEDGDLNGTFGIGPRVEFSPPIPGLALGIVGQGVYYFPDIDDLSFMTYGIAAKVGLSTPLVSPYVIGGWQWRRASFGDFTNTETGPTVGVGVQLGMIPAFLEVTMEFNDEDEIDPDFDTDPLIIQAGVLIGG